MKTTSRMTEVDRVRKNTRASTLRGIDQQIEENVRFYSTQDASVITHRLQELEREWSMERWLETNASALAFTGVVLGLTVSKKWFALPLIVTGFLFQHAVQGWCPPLPLLRELGVRTRHEIDREMFALKVLRGDLKDIKLEPMEQSTQINKILEAVGVTG
jgi:hypothetical protein